MSSFSPGCSSVYPTKLLSSQGGGTVLAVKWKQSQNYCHVPHFTASM